MIKTLPGERGGSRKGHSSQARGTTWTKVLLIRIELPVNPNNPDLFFTGQLLSHSFQDLCYWFGAPRGSTFIFNPTRFDTNKLITPSRCRNSSCLSVSRESNETHQYLHKGSTQIPKTAWHRPGHHPLHGLRNQKPGSLRDSLWRGLEPRFSTCQPTWVWIPPHHLLSVRPQRSHSSTTWTECIIRTPPTLRAGLRIKRDYRCKVLMSVWHMAIQC